MGPRRCVDSDRRGRSWRLARAAELVQGGEEEGRDERMALLNAATTAVHDLVSPRCAYCLVLIDLEAGEASIGSNLPSGKLTECLDALIATRPDHLTDITDDARMAGL